MSWWWIDSGLGWKTLIFVKWPDQSGPLSVTFFLCMYCRLSIYPKCSHLRHRSFWAQLHTLFHIFFLFYTSAQSMFQLALDSPLIPIQPILMRMAATLNPLKSIPRQQTLLRVRDSRWGMNGGETTPMSLKHGSWLSPPRRSFAA